MAGSASKSVYKNANLSFCEPTDYPKPPKSSTLAANNSSQLKIMKPVDSESPRKAIQNMLRENGIVKDIRVNSSVEQNSYFTQQRRESESVLRGRSFAYDYGSKIDPRQSQRNNSGLLLKS
jgi:hypothetical protein